MAASNTELPNPKEKLMTDIDKKVLLCSICKERFKSPQILPCFHTFCKPCLTEWLKRSEGNLICPTCRQAWPLTPEGVPCITNNRFMNDLLELMQDVSSDVQKSTCVACDGEVKYWCKDCGEFFCDNCIVGHKSMRLLKDHKIITISEYNDKKASKHFSLLKPRFCSIHSTVQLEFYCDTCQVPACMKCAIVEHKQTHHDLISIENALKKYTPTMKEYSEKIAHKLADLKQAKAAASIVGENLEKNKSAAVIGIKTVTKNLHDEVEKHEAKYLEDVGIIYSPKRKQIDAHIDLLEQKLGSAESMYSYLNHLLTYGGPVDIMAVKKELDQHLMDDKLSDISGSEDLDSDLVFTENPQCLQINPGAVGTKIKLLEQQKETELKEQQKETKDAKAQVKILQDENQILDRKLSTLHRKHLEAEEKLHEKNSALCETYGKLLEQEKKTRDFTDQIKILQKKLSTFKRKHLEEEKTASRARELGEKKTAHSETLGKTVYNEVTAQFNSKALHLQEKEVNYILERIKQTPGTKGTCKDRIVLIKGTLEQITELLNDLMLMSEAKESLIHNASKTDSTLTDTDKSQTSTVDLSISTDKDGQGENVKASKQGSIQKHHTINLLASKFENKDGTSECEDGQVSHHKEQGKSNEGDSDLNQLGYVVVPEQNETEARNPILHLGDGSWLSQHVNDKGGQAEPNTVKRNKEDSSLSDETGSKGKETGQKSDTGDKLGSEPADDDDDGDGDGDGDGDCGGSGDDDKKAGYQESQHKKKASSPEVSSSISQELAKADGVPAVPKRSSKSREVIKSNITDSAMSDTLQTEKKNLKSNPKDGEKEEDEDRACESSKTKRAGDDDKANASTNNKPGLQSKQPNMIPKPKEGPAKAKSEAEHQGNKDAVPTGQSKNEYFVEEDSQILNYVEMIHTDEISKICTTYNVDMEYKPNIDSRRMKITNRRGSNNSADLKRGHVRFKRMVQKVKASLRYGVIDVRAVSDVTDDKVETAKELMEKYNDTVIHFEEARNKFRLLSEDEKVLIQAITEFCEMLGVTPPDKVCQYIKPPNKADQPQSSTERKRSAQLQLKPEKPGEEDLIINIPFDGNIISYIFNACESELNKMQSKSGVKFDWDGENTMTITPGKGNTSCTKEKLEAVYDQVVCLVQDLHVKLTYKDVNFRDKGIVLSDIKQAKQRTLSEYKKVLIEDTSQMKVYRVYGEAEHIKSAIESFHKNLGLPVPNTRHGKSKKNYATTDQTKTVGHDNQQGSFDGNAVDRQSTLQFTTKDGTKISIGQGDITKETVDVITNAANSALDHAGGVAGAIVRAGGHVIQDESNNITRYKTKLLQVAEVAMTTAGRLPCKSVLHVVGPYWSEQNPGYVQKCLYDCCWNVLKKASEEGFTSIAIPALGTGMYKVPKHICAQMMFEAVHEYSEKQHFRDKLRDIRFLEFDQKTVQTFTEVFQQNLVAYNISFSRLNFKESSVDLPSSGNGHGAVGATTSSNIPTTPTRSGSNSTCYDNKAGTSTYANVTSIGAAQSLAGGATGTGYTRPVGTQSDRAVKIDLSTDYPFKPGASDVDDKKCPICLDEIKKPKTLPCKHTFCKECITTAEKSLGPTCPTCKAAFGTITGNMPPGTMTHRVENFNLSGYFGCGTIVITYYFKSGKQGKEHPDPGQRYTGTTYTAYLPDNREGREVLRLLKIAFDRRLTFTIDTSVTTGNKNTVVWNDIHHKTNPSGGAQGYGYPDSDYLRRVKEELAAKGIK